MMDMSIFFIVPKQKYFFFIITKCYITFYKSLSTDEGFINYKTVYLNCEYHTVQIPLTAKGLV